MIAEALWARRYIPVLTAMPIAKSAGVVGMLIYGGSADAFVFGILVWASAPFDWSGLTGLAVAVGGIITSLYGVYTRSEENRKQIDELKAETKLLKSQKEEMSDEILRLRQGQHDIRGTQAELKYGQVMMREDLKTARGLTPDPEHPLPVTIVPNPNPPPAPGGV